MRGKEGNWREGKGRRWNEREEHHIGGKRKRKKKGKQRRRIAKYSKMKREGKREGHKAQ